MKDTDSPEPAVKKSRLEAGDDDEDELDFLHCKKLGSVFRTGRERLVSMATDDEQTTLICHVSECHHTCILTTLYFNFYR